MYFSMFTISDFILFILISSTRRRFRCVWRISTYSDFSRSESHGGWPGTFDAHIISCTSLFLYSLIRLSLKNSAVTIHFSHTTDNSTDVEKAQVEEIVIRFCERL